MAATLMFSRHRSAPAMLDGPMRAEQARNPETFAVERMSEWSSSLEVYLSPSRVKAMFEPWYGRPPEYGPPQLAPQVQGRNVLAFYAHGDPSEVNHRFGFAMAHLEVSGPQVSAAQILAMIEGDQLPPEDQRPEHHVVFDIIHYWDPADFPDHTIDYPEVMDWVFDSVVIPFRPRDVTFDHYNVPSTVGYLKDKIRRNQARLQGQRTDVHVREVTRQLNWDTAENFKAALYQGLVHAPWHAEGHDELKYLQKPRDKTVCAPDTGPVTTDDIASAIMITTWKLLDATTPYLAKGLAIRPGAGVQGGTDPMARMSPWSEDEMAAVRGQFSASRARGYGQPSSGSVRSGQTAARGLRQEMTQPRGRRSPITRWR